jgi:amino acid transporter
VQAAYQMLISAAIILYFIPFLYMFAGVIKLAARKDRTKDEHAVLIPGGMPGVWLCGGLGFVVVLIGIFVSLVPPGDITNRAMFEFKLIGGTLASIFLGLILYWRGARSKKTA